MNHVSLVKKIGLALVTLLLGFAPALLVASPSQAATYTNVRIWNCGAQQFGGLCHPDSLISTITVLQYNGYRTTISPGDYSQYHLQGFYVDSCYTAQNMSTGNTFAGGRWYYFAAQSTGTTVVLSKYYNGSC